MQRATLLAFQSMQPSSAGESAKVEPAAAAASAAEAWWSLLQSQTQPPAPPEQKSRK
jgi:hypothetical protein